MGGGFASLGVDRAVEFSPNRPPPRRLRHLSWATIGDARYPVATTRLSRLLGLAWCDRDRAGPGLLIPRCRSVHTFGMRFPLDLYFLDADGRFMALRAAVPPRRIVHDRRATAVLEVPARPARG